MAQSSAVLSSTTDLSSLDKNEASKTLFSQIQWEELLRSGVVLQHRDVSHSPTNFIFSWLLKFYSIL
jgi:hypothetical protein